MGASVYGTARAAGPNAIELDVYGLRIAVEGYGLRIAVEGDWLEVAESIGRDFAWFADRGAHTGTRAVAARVRLRIVRCKPRPERFDRLAQAFITPRNTVFQSGAHTIVDYSGRALAAYDRTREVFVLEGEEEHLVHEAAYLFLLSRIGRHLDQSGLMRLHALGLSAGHGAVLVLLPSGGGKTTLALRALSEPGVKLISEDTPVLDRHGMVHPFPLRIGVNESDAGLLPPDGEVHRIVRLEYGPKLLLSTASFADQIEREPQPMRHLVLGRRWLNGGGSLTPVRRRTLIGPLVRDGVVGVGVIVPGWLLAAGAGSLLFSMAVEVSTSVVGLRRSGHSRLMPSALLAPVYELFKGAAAAKAVWQLVTRPHYWEKTAHGLTGERFASEPFAVSVAPSD